MDAAPRYRRSSLATLFLALGSAALVSGVAAQTPSERAAEAADALDFRAIGPANMGGRVADIAVVESDPRIFYVGLGAGGVWKTMNGGHTWETVFDDQPAASIGDVTVAPSNPNVVWVGTGEPQNRQSSPWGVGVFKSTDAGRTWTQMGLEDTHHISRIRIDPSNPDVVYVGAVGHLWGPNAERGVFRTTDGGETWEKVLFVDDDTGVIDLIMDHQDPNTLFAATYQRRRTGFGFAAGGGGSGIWRTTDGGDTWTRLENGLPEGEMGRIGLDIYRRDGNLVYAIIEAHGDEQGVYRTTDRGATWEKVNDRNPRPMYFSLIRIDPNNPERIYIGGVEASASDDGGRTWWEEDVTAGVHLDHHAWWIDPHDSNHVMSGNDGGIAVSRDGGQNWFAITNMPIAQFYEVDYDLSEPYRVCGGLQDNGNWCGPHRTQATWGVRNRDWTHVWFGDGFHNHVDPTDPNIMYSESQGGNMGRIDVATRESQPLRPIARPEGDEERDYRFNWNSPFDISHHDPATLYLGGNHLMRSRDRGLTWEEASPDLTKALDRDTLPIMGRLVTDETLSEHDGTSTNSNITAFAESRHAPDVLWVGTDDGNVQVTRDGGATWTNVVDRIPGVPPRTYVSGIESSYDQPGRFYVTFDGHRNDDYAPYAFATEDYGQTWRRITAGLPDGWSVNRIREDPRNPNLLYLGNEIGVFISIDRGESWARLESNLPTVAVDDIQIHERDNDLILGTHGRSVWILDDVTPLQEMAQEVLAADAHLFGARRATMWSMGMDWPFQPGQFLADNPPDGLPIRYYLREPLAGGTVTQQGDDMGDGGTVAGGPNANGEAPVQAADGLTLEILDGGEVIRTLEPSNERGVNQVVWDFRIEPAFGSGAGGGGGFRGGPGPGQGPKVLPGTYTVRLTVNGAVQTRDVEVRHDPRRNAAQADLMARQELLLEMHELAAPLREANQRLSAMSDRLGEVETSLENADLTDDLRASLLAEAEAIKAEIEEVDDALDDANRLGGASRMEGWSGTPTADQRWAIERTWAEVPAVIERVNALLTDRMPGFEQRLLEAGVRPAIGDPIEVPRRP